MSRSNGKFPEFVKLDIDPKVWPDDYWAQAFVCKQCSTAWPATHLFDPSICCNTSVFLVDGPPEMRWPEAISYLLEARFNNVYEEWNEGVDDKELGWAEVMTHGKLDDAKIEAEIDRLIEESKPRHSSH